MQQFFTVRRLLVFQGIADLLLAAAAFFFLPTGNIACMLGVLIHAYLVFHTVHKVYFDRTYKRVSDSYLRDHYLSKNYKSEISFNAIMTLVGSATGLLLWSPIMLLTGVFAGFLLSALLEYAYKYLLNHVW